MKHSSSFVLVKWTIIVMASLGVCLLKAQDKNESKATALEGAAAGQVELVRRQESLIAAQILVRDAETVMASGDYAKALSLYQEAQKKISGASEAEQIELAKINSGASRCLFQLGTEAYNSGNYALAAQQAERAHELDGTNPEIVALYERASERINKEEARKQMEEKEIKAIPPEISNTDFVAKQKKVMELYRAAENYAKSEQFDQAEQALKSILSIDPYSATAYHRLRDIQLAKYKKLDAARLQTETESILDVQKGWALPVRRDVIQITSDQNGGVDGGTDR